MVAASEVRRLEERVRELERLLGRKAMEVEILKEAPPPQSDIGFATRMPQFPCLDALGPAPAKSLRTMNFLARWPKHGPFLWFVDLSEVSVACAAIVAEKGDI